MRNGLLAEIQGSLSLVELLIVHLYRLQDVLCCAVKKVGVWGVLVAGKRPCLPGRLLLDDQALKQPGVGLEDVHASCHSDHNRRELPDVGLVAQLKVVRLTWLK